MNRRSFLKLPALLPLTAFGSLLRPEEHCFRYERVIGTSLDLVVWTKDSGAAESGCRIVLEEIDRLASILDTRNAASEISQLENAGRRDVSPDLSAVLRAYDYWERRTNGVVSVRPDGIHAVRNVDALGKAYILDRAAKLAQSVLPQIDALLLNIGGDIVTWGRACTIAVADPGAWYDNAEPITWITLHNAAVASSGTYARGAHLKDARTGQAPESAAAATVVAADAVTANALATMLCLTSAEEGLPIVESTHGAEALRVSSGITTRTSRFALLESPPVIQTQVSSNWPAGYQLKITLPLTSGRSSKRPYVAVWVEDSSGKLVRMLAIWGNKSKYYPDLSSFWNFLKVKYDLKQFASVTRATRPAGKYELVWQGLDAANKPVPPGAYRVVVETNQERGTYAKESGTIVIGDTPASITLPATTNFEPVQVQYGPK
jgi:thiamine biosynthesis lipoprotein ApbE